jgi:hypothetical protein
VALFRQRLSFDNFLRLSGALEHFFDVHRDFLPRFLESVGFGCFGAFIRLVSAALNWR